MSDPIPAQTGADPVELHTPHAPDRDGVNPATDAVKRSFLLKAGGGLGIGATTISMTIFLLGCFGLEGLFAKLGLASIFGCAVAPLLMSVPGLLLSIAGGSRKGVAAIDPNVLAAVFVNILGLSGALIELAVWRQWSVFYGGGGA